MKTNRDVSDDSVRTCPIMSVCISGGDGSATQRAVQRFALDVGSSEAGITVGVSTATPQRRHAVGLSAGAATVEIVGSSDSALCRTHASRRTLANLDRRARRSKRGGEVVGGGSSVGSGQRLGQVDEEGARRDSHRAGRSVVNGERT